MRRSLEIQGLRTLCIAVVMLFHYAVPFRDTLLSGGFYREALYRVANVGWIGVDFFFAISGFVVTLVLLRCDQDYRAFMKRRASRLLPAYFSVLVAAGVVTLAAPLLALPIKEGFVDNQVWAWTLTANVASSIAGEMLDGGSVTLVHLWSLCVEMQFYLVWPMVVWHLSPRNRFVAMCSVALVAVSLRGAAVYAEVYYNAIYSLTPFRLDAFSIGGIAALFAAEGRKVRSAPWIALCLLVPSLLWLLADVGWHKANDLVQVIGYTVIGAGAAALVLSAYQETLWRQLRAVLASKPLVHIGDRSYSLYLWHLPFMGSVNLELPSLFPITGLAAVLVATLVNTFFAFVLAETSYRLIEVPFQRVGNKKDYARTAMVRSDRTARRHPPLRG